MGKQKAPICSLSLLRMGNHCRQNTAKPSFSSDPQLWWWVKQMNASALYKNTLSFDQSWKANTILTNLIEQTWFHLWTILIITKKKLHPSLLDYRWFTNDFSMRVISNWSRCSNVKKQNKTTKKTHTTKLQLEKDALSIRWESPRCRSGSASADSWCGRRRRAGGVSQSDEPAAVSLPLHKNLDICMTTEFSWLCIL